MILDLNAKNGRVGISEALEQITDGIAHSISNGNFNFTVNSTED